MSQNLCSLLPAFQHAVLATFSEKCSRKGLSKLSPTSVAAALGCDAQDVRDVLVDLTDHLYKAEEGWWLRRPCTCTREGVFALQMAVATGDYRHVVDDASRLPGLVIPTKSSSDSSTQRRALASRKPPNSSAEMPPHARARRLGENPRQDSVKPVEKWNGYDLASYFCAQAQSDVRRGLSHGPLRGTFARWRKQQIYTSLEIKTMIDFFLRKPEFSDSTPTWKLFVWRHEKWYRRAERYLKDKEHEAHRHGEGSREYWVGAHAARR